MLKTGSCSMTGDKNYEDSLLKGYISQGYKLEIHKWVSLRQQQPRSWPSLERYSSDPFWVKLHRYCQSLQVNPLHVVKEAFYNARINPRCLSYPRPNQLLVYAGDTGPLNSKYNQLTETAVRSTLVALQLSKSEIYEGWSLISDGDPLDTIADPVIALSLTKEPTFLQRLVAEVEYLSAPAVYQHWASLYLSQGLLDLPVYEDFFDGVK